MSTSSSRPIKPSRETPPVAIPDRKIVADINALSTCFVQAEDGSAVPMQLLWMDQSAIFIFLRHFACDVCRQHAVEVWSQRHLYEAKGAKLHFIGNGTTYFMNQFREQHQMQSASFYTDPSLNAFTAAGFRRGFWINPGELFSRTEYLAAAIRQQLRQPGVGSVWQLGGVLAVRPDNRITYQSSARCWEIFHRSVTSRLSGLD